MILGNVLFFEGEHQNSFVFKTDFRGPGLLYLYFLIFLYVLLIEEP